MGLRIARAGCASGLRRLFDESLEISAGGMRLSDLDLLQHELQIVFRKLYHNSPT